jgi:hypothetical protein
MWLLLILFAVIGFYYLFIHKEAGYHEGVAKYRSRTKWQGTHGTVKLIDNAFWLLVDSGEMLRISENCQGLEAGQQVVISNFQLVETFEVNPVLKAS